MNTNSTSSEITPPGPTIVGRVPPPGVPSPAWTSKSSPPHSNFGFRTGGRPQGLGFRISAFGFSLLLLLLTTRAFSATFTVDIRNFYFNPTNLVIQPGDTVTWHNASFTPHDTTHNAPAGQRLWASPLIPANGNFSFTFNQAGFYPYVCSIHVGIFPQQTGTVTVVSLNLPPTVAITSPSEGASFTAPANINIHAAATDSDGTVTNVQFFLNGAPFTNSAGPDFTVTATGLAASNYVVTAMATDDAGATASSAPVNISVRDPIRYPLSLAVSPQGSGSVTANPPAPEQGYDEGSVVSLTATASEGFAFSNWTGSASGTQNPLVITMDSAKTIVAGFAPIVIPPVTLITVVDPPGSGTIDVSPAPNAADGAYVRGTLVTLTAIAAPDFAFSNWSGSVTGTSNQVTLLLDVDKTATARFTVSLRPTHSLTVTTNPPGAGRIDISPPPNGRDGLYIEGTVVSLTATAIGTNAFGGWTGATNSTNDSISLVIDADKDLAATFVPIVPPVFSLNTTVSPPGGGAINVTPASSNGIYSAGTVLALAAEPAAGFRFVRWRGAVASTNNPVPLVMNADKSVIADFEILPVTDFTAARGAYHGLLLAAQNRDYTTSGFISLRLAKSGSCRGTIIGGIHELFAGQFDRFGYAPLVLRRGTLSGSLLLNAPSNRIDGILTDVSAPPGTPSLVPDLLLFRSPTGTNAARFAGSHHLNFPPAFPVPEPGAVDIVITPGGAVRIRGRLGDGTPVLARTFVSESGVIPVFVRLYHGRGLLIGWLEYTPAQRLEGTLKWFRPADSRSLPFPHGFAVDLPAVESQSMN